MAKTTSIRKEITAILPHVERLGSSHITFDTDVDVLYISLEKPQNATDTETSEDGTLYRYRGKKLVGMTILNFSKNRKYFLDNADSLIPRPYTTN